MAAARPAGADGPSVPPDPLGEEAPIQDPAARGVLAGLTLDHDFGHLWRAMLGAYACAVAHHVEVLNAMGHGATCFIASAAARRGARGRVVRPDPAHAEGCRARRGCRVSGRGGPA